MPKTEGATDKVQRIRRGKTDREKAITKENKKKEKQKKQNTAKSLFFPPLPFDAPVPDPPPTYENAEPGSEVDMVVNADDIAHEELHDPGFMEVVPDEEIIAELDAEREDEDQTEDDEDADFEIEQGDADDSSVMKIHLKAIQARLRKELSAATTMNSKEKWLLELLQDNEWWIESKRARKVCGKLSLQFAEKSHYRDVRVWFPELEHGQECMPSCVSCRSNCKVGVHACSKKAPARRVVALTTNYFVMSRQYICHVCSKLNKERKAQAVGNPYEKVQYTFMGYNSEVHKRIFACKLELTPKYTNACVTGPCPSIPQYLRKENQKLSKLREERIFLQVNCHKLVH